MKNSIINRYIFSEILSNFLLGIAVFTMILLMGRLIKLTEMVLSRGVPFIQVTKMILSLLPSFLVFTIPMAFLLSILLAFGRLSSDNEITVLKASGISIFRLMPSPLLFALFISLICFQLTMQTAPHGNLLFRQLSLQVLRENASATLREKVFWDELPGMVIYCNSYDEVNRRVEGIIIHDSRDSANQMTIFAEKGIINSSAESSYIGIALEGGSIHSLSAKDEYRYIKFGKYLVNVPLAAGFAGNGKLNESELTITDLKRQLKDSSVTKGTRLKLESELHSRLALPVASFVFVLLAVPLAIQNRRSGKSVGFSIAIGVLLSYYILFSFMKSLAEKGSLPSVVALWIPNIFFGLAGYYLLKRVSGEKSLHG